MAKGGGIAVLQGVGLLVIGGLIGYWAGVPGGAKGVPAAALTAGRGAQLVALAGCDDCHTPKRADGSFDMSRRLAGYTNTDALPNAQAGTITINMELTAFRGPWGLSQSRNLTPDAETGIGKWSFVQFRRALRTGVDPAGRAILPPMRTGAAWSEVPDADLEAMYNFIRTLPGIHNAVTGP